MRSAVPSNSLSPQWRDGFEVAYRGGELSLDGSEWMSEEQRSYALAYLNRLNRYRPISLTRDGPAFSLYQPPPASATGIRALGYRLARRFDGVRLPATATLSVTKACQCHCEHCSAVFYNGSTLPMLSEPLLIQAISETVALGATTIILLGGEPLLRPELDALIAGVPAHLATVVLFTNGEYLSHSRCERLARSGLYGAFVSIDSPDPQEHDRCRGRPGLFNRAIAGLVQLKAAGVLCGISSYLTPQRLRDGVFERMMTLGRELGVHEVTFFDAIPSGRWLHQSPDLLSSEDRAIIARLVRDYRNMRGFPGMSVQSTLTSDCGSAFCFAANTQFYLTAAGQMCPCDFTPLSIGTFPQNSIAELWNCMISTAPYNTRAKSCRMQDAQFRKRYIDPIPSEGPFPYPL